MDLRLQLLLDMLEVGEATDWSLRPSTAAKYRALRCFLRALPPDSEEFRRVAQHVTSSGSE